MLFLAHFWRLRLRKHLPDVKLRILHIDCLQVVSEGRGDLHQCTPCRSSVHSCSMPFAPLPDVFNYLGCLPFELLCLDRPRHPCKFTAVSSIHITSCGIVWLCIISYECQDHKLNGFYCLFLAKYHQPEM